MKFEDFGFATNYRAVDGIREGARTLGFDANGRCREWDPHEPGDAVGATPITIEPDTGDPWVGYFAAGPGTYSGLFASPHPDIVCVVARGQGYLVSASEPTRFELVSSTPVVEVFRARDYLAFADHITMTAYGTDGLCWQTRRLSWDGLKIHTVIEGAGWDSPAESWVPVRVDIDTGEATGGARPSD